MNCLMGRFRMGCYFKILSWVGICSNQLQQKCKATINHDLLVLKYSYWLVVWLTFFVFPYIGNNHPNWLIFFRVVQTTNQTGLTCLTPQFFSKIHGCPRRRNGRESRGPMDSPLRLATWTCRGWEARYPQAKDRNIAQVVAKTRWCAPQL